MSKTAKTTKKRPNDSDRPTRPEAQVDTFPYLGPLITEDGECTTEFRTRLNRGRTIAAENTEKSRHIDFKEDTTDESASVVCSNILM